MCAVRGLAIFCLAVFGVWGGVPVAAEEVVFPDLALEVEIRNKLDIHEGPIDSEDLLRLEDLSLYETQVKDLTGIEHCTNVTVVNAQSNRIEKIESLGKMPQLQQVWLNNNAISDLTPLTKIPYLRDLSISGNPIDDLTPLGGMFTLRRLGIGGFALRDPGFLSKLVHLEHLYIARTGIDNLDFAAEMPKLESLLASDNQIASLEPMRGLEHLEQLELKNNRIGDLTPLAGLTEVWWLELRGNHLGSLEGMPKLHKRAKVLLYDNAISDIRPLVWACSGGEEIIIELGLNQLGQEAFCTQIPALERLGVRVVYRRKSPNDESVPYPDLGVICEAARQGDGGLVLAAVNRGATAAELAADFGIATDGPNNAPAEIVPFIDANLEQAVREHLGQVTGPITLTDAASIERLDVSGREIHDLRGLEHLANLKMAGLQSNRIHDLGPLAELERLETLFLAYNQIEELSPLAALENLKQLGIEYNAVTRIAPIVRLPVLRELTLTGNPITDVELAGEARGLSDLNVNGLGLTSLDFLAGLTRMRKLNAADNQVASLEPLRDLRQLIEINLAGNQVRDLSPIAKHENVYRLDLRNNNLGDVAGLPRFRREATLLLHGNSISDIGPIAAAAGHSAAVCIELGRNSLSQEAFCSDIPELVARGHRVVYSYSLPKSVDFPDPAVVCGAMDSADAGAILAAVNGGATEAQLLARFVGESGTEAAPAITAMAQPRAGRQENPSAVLGVTLADREFNVSVESSGLDLWSLLGGIALVGVLVLLVIAVKLPWASR